MRKHLAMTADELAATREQLGWDRERMSREIGVLPAELGAMEAGALPIPRETSELALLLAAAEARQAVLRESGLPECPEFHALEAALVGCTVDEERPYMLRLLRAHHAACAVCLQRAVYADRHAPLPPLHEPFWLRVMGGLAGVGDGLPRRLRPPPGRDGEHRRTGVFIGAYLTLFAVLLIGMSVVMELVAGRRGDESALEAAFVLPLLAVAYLAGGYMAGAAWDATRGIRHRLIGYLRGAGTAAAMYGALMIALPMMKDPDMPAPVYLAGVGVLTVGGALAGAAKWLKDRRADNLPDPPAAHEPG